MLRIEPTTATNYASKASAKMQQVQSNQEQDKTKGKNMSILGFTLAGLASAGIAAIGLQKTSPMSYEQALNKAGVAIKDGIATVIESGEKYTGKIQRFEKRNRKETVEFVEGKMTEKNYHNLMGRELDGCFYKDGILNLRVTAYDGGKYKSFAFNKYSDKGSSSKGDMFRAPIDSVFEWARKYVKTGKVL